MMKLLKPVSVLLMLFALVIFTSCLKSEDPQPATRYGIVTIKADMLGKTLLKNDFGDTFYVSVNSSGKNPSMIGGRAIIIYRLINEDALSNTDKKPLDIELLSMVGITRNVSLISRDEASDSLKIKYVDPILGFDRMVENGDSIVTGDGYITAAIDYRFSKNITKNRFTLFRYMEDKIKPAVNGPDTLDLYLGRSADGDAEGQYKISSVATSDPNYWPYYFFAFDVSPLISTSYDKDAMILRINYKKLEGDINKKVVDAVQLVKYPTK